MGDPTRDDLVDAVLHGQLRLQKAIDAYNRHRRRPLELLRVRQVAEDEYRALVAELQEYDDARDIRALYRAEKSTWRRRR